MLSFHLILGPSTAARMGYGAERCNISNVK